MFKPALLAAALVVAGAVAAPAATVQFTPTNDALGRIFTTNSNDGWKDGRGIGFQVASTQTITSVGVMQDLKRKWLNFGIYEISSLTGSFSRGKALRSGSEQITTQGLSWIDFSFDDLALDVDKTYLLEFSFNGSAKQNFFHNNANVAWSQGAFLNMEGTSGSSFSNSVVGAFRVGQPDPILYSVPVDEPEIAPVPLPAGLSLLGGALGALALFRRRRG
ncbi:MAG: VPLPA-CTERM sorting domain-containing protein [Pseudooceanicola sp.]|nr:VPLPA-CTERM sorting domain-containing protein [Pseudooceanicola sp.]